MNKEFVTWFKPLSISFNYQMPKHFGLYLTITKNILENFYPIIIIISVFCGYAHCK